MTFKVALHTRPQVTLQNAETQGKGHYNGCKKERQESWNG